jgi:hypothetical protein
VTSDQGSEIGGAHSPKTAANGAAIFGVLRGVKISNMWASPVVFNGIGWRRPMFKRGWLRRGRIYSDEGFSVGLVDRTSMVYREHGRKVRIAGERLRNGFVIYAVTIGPWEDGTPIDAAQEERIASNIRRALESQGMTFGLD